MSSPYTFENPESWIDLHTIVIVGFKDNNMLAISYQHDTYTATTQILLRRILKELKHKIIKWDKLIDYQSLKCTDTLYTDIPYDKWVQAEDLYLKDMADMGYDEKWINHDRNNSSPSDDDSLSQQSDDSEEEPSPQPAL